MQTVLSLSPEKARDYFMNAEQYCGIALPSYINFQPILDYVKKVVGMKDLADCLKEDKQLPSYFDQVNYKILVNKDGKYAYRPIQIANPYLYYLLVRNITTKDSWEALQRRFEEFKDSHIEVSSIPPIKDEKDKSTLATIISNWWSNLEQRSIELSIKYKYMFITDITNCYGSIYTHSIHWAISEKEESKKNRKQPSLGRTIDTYMQGMQYGQTNGIPQGGALFDFIAEIVLGYADKLLVERLKEQQIEDYKILRYRDDYRIFSNNKDELEKISLILQTVLADLNFNMNASKTMLTDSIVENAIKPDKYFYISNIPVYKKEQSLFASFQKELLYILSIAKRYPNSGTICMLMTNISKRIQNHDIMHENINVLVAIVIEIAINSPKVYQQVLACISNLVNRIDDEDEKISLIKDVYNKLSTLPNIGHIQIWMQRITVPIDKKSGDNPYEETLCKIIYGEQCELWNLDWLKPELQAGLPIDKICDEDTLREMVPFIAIEEVDMFSYQ